MNGLREQHWASATYEYGVLRLKKNPSEAGHAYLRRATPWEHQPRRWVTGGVASSRSYFLPYCLPSARCPPVWPYNTSPLEKVKTILCYCVILLCTRIYAPTCVYAPSPNPLNLIEGPTLERAARGGPLQLSTRTPSPPSTPPHWIKFVNAPITLISS